MKKLFSLLLTLVLLIGLIPAASAASSEAQQAAEALYELGLFRGNGTLPDGSPNFALDQTPTRNQAVIMLVRLLGKEEEALAGNWDLPFTDVSKTSAAYPYIGYAYANKLTNGTSATTFGGGNPIRANQYITFVLRAMGYESGKDFAVSTAWEFSDSLGITKGQYNATNAGSFLRSGIAEVSYGALSAKVSGTETTLLEKLKADGAVPETAVTPTPDTGDTVPADLTFKTIDSTYYQTRGYFNQLKSFQLKDIAYADGGENIYIRVNYSGNVKKFLVCPAGIPGEGGMGDMLRFDTSAANGVFTCKVSKSLFKEYPCLLISPAEDGKSGPVDYFIFMGYLQLTESGAAAVFQPVTEYKDGAVPKENYYVNDSHDVADFRFQSAEYAEVVGGRLYRIRFTNDAHRNIQLWTLKNGQREGFNQNLLRVVHPQAGESETYYYVPHYVLKDYEHIFVRVRDAYAIDPNGGQTQQHCSIDIYF